MGIFFVCFHNEGFLKSVKIRLAKSILDTQGLKENIMLIFILTTALTTYLNSSTSMGCTLHQSGHGHTHGGGGGGQGHRSSSSHVFTIPESTTFSLFCFSTKQKFSINRQYF